MMKMKTIYGFLSTFSLKLVFVFVFLALVSLGFISAQEVQSPTVCCEKTKPTLQNPDGMFCQDVPPEQCSTDEGIRKVPTSCQSTSYCKPGTCFDQSQGTCLDNTPELLCGPGGKWKETPGPECELACCILGDQAALVTLTRCKYLSSKLGLKANYKKEIKNMETCIDLVLGQEKGACVYEFEFQDTCRITTKAECAEGVSGTQTKGTFFRGKLCTADFSDLNIVVNCARQDEKICVPGKEEVYFVDTCGNPANIYDSAKVDDMLYWENILDKNESCNSDSPNIDNPSCGNCNYLEGSICRTNSKGNAKCVDLNCDDTSNGNDYNHGERWCVYSDAGPTEGNNAVGSRFYMHTCNNGKEVLEQCADFRQQICIEDSIPYAEGKTFSQAGCRVNRWQDCIMQSKGSCENTDHRDCVWLGGFLSSCVPKVSPGLEFWEGDEAQTICGQASTTCVATYTKKIGGKKKWKGVCVDSDGNIEPGWISGVNSKCYALGDCVGSLGTNNKLNWLGK